MAKQVQPLEIILGIKGAEKLAALKSSFRDLTKTVRQTDAGIEAARKSINDYANSANSSEAVIRGQIKAFEGLREQAAMGGKTYSRLSKDIAELKAQLNGSTSSIDAKRKSLLELAAGADVTGRQVQRVIDRLAELRSETRLDSGAFNAFGKDIDNLTGKLDELAARSEAAARKSKLLSGPIRSTPGEIKAQLRANREEAAAIQGQIDAIDELDSRQRKLKKNVEERAALEERLAERLKIASQTGFLASVSAGRKAVISAANAFNDADAAIGSFSTRLRLLDRDFGEIPDTIAGSNQNLRELQEQFANTARSADSYVAIALEIARVQREATAATQGLGAALVQDLASGVAVRSQRNLREAMGQLQAEMAELNTTTAEGSAKYAQNAAQVSRLQKELDGIANSYRNVSDAARQAGMATGGASLNPFAASGARNPAFMREKEKQEMEQIAQLQQELNGLQGEYVDSVRSALQTIQEYQQKRHDDFMRQVDERITAEQKASQDAIENTRREAQALDDQFNTMLQQRKAAASAMGIGGREDMSSLYQGIIGLSTADIRRQQEMMGKSATEVFNDIATAFEKGGRAVDLKQKSTDIGDSIAEGVVDGASESNEINKGAKTFAQKLIAAYKAAFGIKSPSKETEQKIGIPLGLGIIRGLLSALRSGKKEVQREIQSIAETPLVPRSRNLPVGVTGLSGAALTNALMGYSRQKRGVSGGGYPELRGIFPGANTSFRGGVAPGKFSFGGQEALPPSKPQLALPSAEMREFFRDIELEFRKLRAKVRGGSEGEHFMEPGRGGGRYQGGFLGGGGGGGGGRRGAAGSAGGEFDKLNQVLRDFGPLSDRSVNDIRELGASLNSLQDIISPLDADFEQVNKAIAKQSRLIDRELQKRERQRSRRRMSPMQMTQAAGAAISGGIFGGPEGFLGGVGGALVGGVGGAFAGAAFGAQVGGLRRTLGGYSEYAAQIERLKIALAGIAGPQEEYNRALAAANSVTKDLNVPQEVAIQGITRLTAAVKGAGGGVADAELAFKNINSAIIATGGGAEQVEGAVTALVQIFSKGKVSAEEINQIAERLPGTFNKIAAASGRTGPELTKALQDGKVGLNDLMKFLVSLGDEYGALALKIAASSENAGARLQIAYNNMRIEVGKALQPIGAEFQDAFAEFIKDITPALVSAAKAVGDGLRFVIQNREAITVVASFALRLAAVNLALKAFASLNGPISAMFALLRTGFKATTQQAALAQTKLVAFGRTVKTLAVSLAAPIVITFAVVGAEMVIAYFNRIKKARADLEATAKKPQGEVFFRSIGGTAATKQTLQKNINDITKNLDILRDRVESTKKELKSLEETTPITYGGGGGGLPTKGVADRSREDLKARLQADEAEIKRLVLNYRTLVDKYIEAPDAAAGLSVFPDPSVEGKSDSAGSKKAARDAERRAEEIARLKRAYDLLFAKRQILTVDMQLLDAARFIDQAQKENNAEAVDALRRKQSDLAFEKDLLAAKIEYDGTAREIKETLDGQQRTIAESTAQEQLRQSINVALGEQLSRILTIEQDITDEKKKQRQAIEAELTDRKKALGLISEDEYNAALMERESRRLREQFPRATEGQRAEMLDLYRQQIDPTPFELLQQNISRLKKELKELVDPVNQITGAANAIGTSFADSFKSVVSGSATAQEALAGFFRNIANYFLDMAAQIIQKWITMAILNTALKLFPTGNLTTSSGVSMSAGTVAQAGYNMGSSLASMFANGGIMTEKGPLKLNRYASGGIARGPQLAMFGEGSMPEAYVPLPDGRSIPVTMRGSAGVQVDAINITIENTGDQLTPAAQKQLAGQVQGIVLSTLANERRSGGML